MKIFYDNGPGDGLGGARHPDSLERQQQGRTPRTSAEPERVLRPGDPNPITTRPAPLGAPPEPPAGFKMTDAQRERFHSELAGLDKRETSARMKSLMAEFHEEFRQAQAGSATAAPGQSTTGQDEGSSTAGAPAADGAENGLEDIFEGIVRAGEGFAQRLRHAPDDNARQELLDRGEQEIVNRFYRGDADAAKREGERIATALVEIGGEELLNQVLDSGVTADPAAWQRLAMLAANVLRRKANKS